MLVTDEGEVVKSHIETALDAGEALARDFTRHNITATQILETIKGSGTLPPELEAAFVHYLFAAFRPQDSETILEGSVGINSSVADIASSLSMKIRRLDVGILNPTNFDEIVRLTSLVDTLGRYPTHFTISGCGLVVSATSELLDNSPYKYDNPWRGEDPKPEYQI